MTDRECLEKLLRMFKRYPNTGGSLQRKVLVQRASELIEKQLEVKKPETLPEIEASIRRCMAVIAAERDQLRELHDDLTDLLDSTTEGLHEIECGIDRLSEYV